jgi:hypothetical protein
MSVTTRLPDWGMSVKMRGTSLCLGSLYGQGPAGLRIQFCFLHVIPAHQKYEMYKIFSLKKYYNIERIG